MRKETKPLGWLYRFAYGIWTFLPRWLKDRFYRNKILTRIKLIIRDSTAIVAGREDIYNKDYYELVDKMAQRSFKVISESIVHEINPKSCLDVGCGTGALMLEL